MKKINNAVYVKSMSYFCVFGEVLLFTQKYFDFKAPSVFLFCLLILFHVCSVSKGSAICSPKFELAEIRLFHKMSGWNL